MPRRGAASTSSARRPAGFPARTARIAGALQYREYDAFTRQLMRLLMKRMGHPTDTSQDYDYTDWEAVDRLGRETAALARGAVRA